MTRSTRFRPGAVSVRRQPLLALPPFARVGVGSVQQMRWTPPRDAQGWAAVEARMNELIEHQPALAEFCAVRLGTLEDARVRDLARLALSSLFGAFRLEFGARLLPLSHDQVLDAEGRLHADETRRRTRGTELLDTDDAVAREQPALLVSLNELVALVLDDPRRELDIDELWEVFRLCLVLVVALSGAVVAPGAAR